MIRRIASAVATVAMAAMAMTSAHAGGSVKDDDAPAPFKNFQIKAGISGVLWNNDNKGIDVNGTRQAGWDAAANDIWLPTATLTYYFSPNIAAELFCCFAKATVEGKGALTGQGDLAETWAFPPILTLQYHFTGMGPIKPYIGAGVQWIHYFSSESKIKNLGYNKVEFDDSFGLALQAGFDYDLGRGWSFGLDAKYVWTDTEITFTDGGGNRITTDHDLDPLIVTANIGYRFNLEDLFGRRASYEPMK